MDSGAYVTAKSDIRQEMGDRFEGQSNSEIQTNDGKQRYVLIAQQYDTCSGDLRLESEIRFICSTRQVRLDRRRGGIRPR